MFWSGNYIAVRELNSLLKEENVTLSQVLEADDILQECKADNKALMLFLTRPDILNELITLITEEPPKTVELSQQYRHANIACEVLTSHLSMLSDRLSSDTVQMNRLCDFVSRDPPLNPLLASYFSKTVEMLLEKSPKQDCYLYHIVCLRVLDFFKSRRDFLPNLLRHISTSAIADVFKYFIRLDDLFNKIVMEWLEEHQFLESLIQIVTGNYVAEGERAEPERDSPDLNHNQGGDEQRDHQGNKGECEEDIRERGRARRARVAADNACALLAEVVAGGYGAEGGGTRTALALSARLGSAAGVALLLGGAFTSPERARAMAVAHVAALLPRLQAGEGAGALAPHLPLLHRALTHPPEAPGAPGAPGSPRGVGAARLQIAGLVAALAASPVQEVCTALLALGTPAVLLDLFVQYPDNNFLHASVVAMVRNALNNPVYRTQYAEHLFVECDLLNRIMDLYEENENKESGPRRGHAGHVTQLAATCAGACGAGGGGGGGGGLPVPPAVQPRWEHFVARTLTPLLQMLDTPLGGSHPADCIYEVDSIMDTLAANFDFSDMAATANMEDMGDDLPNEHELGVRERHADSPEGVAAGMGLHDDDDNEDKMNTAKSNFLELANQRFDVDMWDDTPEEEGDGDGEGGENVLDDFSPWVGAGSSSQAEQEADQWAQFGSFSAPPVDPFAPASASASASASAPAPAPPPEDFAAAFWPYEERGSHLELEERLRALQLEPQQASLATNLLTAMSGMSAAALATLVAGDIGPDIGTIPHPTAHSTGDEVTTSADSDSIELKTDHARNDATTDVKHTPEASISEAQNKPLVSDVTDKGNLASIDSLTIPLHSKANNADTDVKSTAITGTEAANTSVDESTVNESLVPDGTDRSKTTAVTDKSSEETTVSSSGDITTDVQEAAKHDSTESKDDSRSSSENIPCVEDVKSEIETGSSSAIDNEPSVVENEVDSETNER